MMFKSVLRAGVMFAALIPAATWAQTTCVDQQNNRILGTVAGAGIGALLGSAVAGRSDRTTGAIIGGIGGAVIGNQVAKSSADCTRAYGYYDNGGSWRAMPRTEASPTGYYDRAGDWVEGAPRGRYDANGNWRRDDVESDSVGYRNASGAWVPAAADGYYNTRNEWVGGTAGGHYNSRGQWVAGSVNGHYDTLGRWQSGESAGRRDANGTWLPDAAPGYYSRDGRWNPGATYGYYDTRGRWMETAQGQARPVQTAPYQPYWVGAPYGARARSEWLTLKVKRERDRGRFSRANSEQALRELNQFRREEQRLRHYRGVLGPRDGARMQARLDVINVRLNWNQ